MKKIKDEYAPRGKMGKEFEEFVKKQFAEMVKKKLQVPFTLYQL